MRVSTSQPYRLIYSLFAHEYLGYLFESFVVQLNDLGELSFLHQNISAKNMNEFSEVMDESDFKLIKLMDSIQQDVVSNKFQNKHLKPDEFFLKVFDPEKGDETVQKAIQDYVDRKMADILPMLYGKEVYSMGNDGEPVGNKITIPKDKATVLFHFMRNEENTHYFPTIKHDGKKVDFQYNGSQIICHNPAWLLVNESVLYTFKKGVASNKLKPFLHKKFIEIPKKVEDTYYQKFVAQIVQDFDVHAKGFDIVDERYEPTPKITFKDLASTQQASLSLFDDKKTTVVQDNGKIVFDLSFKYGTYTFSAEGESTNSVKMEKKNDSFLFHKISRDSDFEKEQITNLGQIGLKIRNGKAVIAKADAFEWLNRYKTTLEELGYTIEQSASEGRRYFLGTSSINIEVKENNDWFDIYALIKFGEYEISFIDIRNLILAKKREFELPNGEIAVIPEEWLTQYSDLLAFSEEGENGLHLKKHHIALIQELEGDGISKIQIDRKLEKLKEFENIENFPLPKNFKGTLRPYQQAGYNWLQFLHSYNFGGCLADDMGLGKTVQTLALIQYYKEQGVKNATLLVMPTSLVYNWEMEAKKFAPDLKVLVYTGTYRDKNIEQFEHFDIILTSYGITRIDIELLKNYYFNYIILDESQAIKNPISNISKSVKELKSKYKLILTGTPIENSTMDLWSQMSFANPGLLGSHTFFKKEYLAEIEKKNDEDKKHKLHAIIKPFILRRLKENVLTELPPKIEQIWYSEMTTEQEKEYEEVKSFYRNKILTEIDSKGINKSQILLLQGLTKLRQIANHPKMVEPDYEHSSGKLDDVMEMLKNAIAKKHKILVFSQFVKYLQIFKKEFEKEGIDFTYLDGSTKDRQAQVETFQENDEKRVFLISLKAGGLGLNLTAADYVFILDPWWNPAIEAQAVDRAYRMGQKNTVHTYKFITRNTVEEKILKLQDHKKALANDLISSEDSFVKSLTKEDIAEILN